MFSEYQGVRLRHPVSPLDGGAKGTIVMVYESAEKVGYEVEFFDDEGNTTALLTLYDGDLEAIREGEQSA